MTKDNDPPTSASGESDSQRNSDDDDDPEGNECRDSEGYIVKADETFELPGMKDAWGDAYERANVSGKNVMRSSEILPRSGEWEFEKDLEPAFYVYYNDETDADAVIPPVRFKRAYGRLTKDEVNHAHRMAQVAYMAGNARMILLVYDGRVSPVDYPIIVKGRVSGHEWLRLMLGGASCRLFPDPYCPDSADPEEWAWRTLSRVTDEKMNERILHAWLETGSPDYKEQFVKMVLEAAAVVSGNRRVYYYRARLWELLFNGVGDHVVMINQPRYSAKQHKSDPEMHDVDDSFEGEVADWVLVLAQNGALPTGVRLERIEKKQCGPSWWSEEFWVLAKSTDSVEMDIRHAVRAAVTKNLQGSTLSHHADVYYVLDGGARNIDELNSLCKMLDSVRLWPAQIVSNRKGGDLQTIYAQEEISRFQAWIFDYSERDAICGILGVIGASFYYTFTENTSLLDVMGILATALWREEINVFALFAAFGGKKWLLYIGRDAISSELAVLLLTLSTVADETIGRDGTLIYVWSVCAIIAGVMVGGLAVRESALDRYSRSSHGYGDQVPGQHWGLWRSYRPHYSGDETNGDCAWMLLTHAVKAGGCTDVPGDVGLSWLRGADPDDSGGHKFHIGHAHRASPGLERVWVPCGADPPSESIRKD